MSKIVGYYEINDIMHDIIKKFTSNRNFHFSLEEINSKLLIIVYDYYETDLNFKFRQKIKFFKNYFVLNRALL